MIPPAEPLLIRVMRDGEPVKPMPGLVECRVRAADQLAHLPARYRVLEKSPVYPVEYSNRLEEERLKLSKKIGQPGR